MKLKTRFDNLMGKIAGEQSAKSINAKTKSEMLLKEIGDGPSGGAYTIRVDNSFTLDKTWNEIKTAMRNGNVCIAVLSWLDREHTLYASAAFDYGGNGGDPAAYAVAFFVGVVGVEDDVTGSFIIGYADSPDGYPVLYIN